MGDIFKKILFFLTDCDTFDDLRNWFFADLSVPHFEESFQGVSECKTGRYFERGLIHVLVNYSAVSTISTNSFDSYNS